ncbi:MAG: hypothetical protein IJS54_06505 [Desulfovibrio sp.]|nr:hypothetical protein [Desulfovibrio sp.]
MTVLGGCVFVAVYGVKIHVFGQSVYYTASEDLHRGDKVLVREDERLCLATVTQGPLEKRSFSDPSRLPSIIRPMNANDSQHAMENARLAKAANAFCRHCIMLRKLDMKLVCVEVFFDRSKIIFFFTAPTRIDFRELVKDLVRQYHTRIELRQIGVRHETQMIGAIGNCGMICCCKRYLRGFAPVTIRMAKEQNLFLNPSKISGSCGRLLCCLSYEQENYDNFFSKSPRIGKKYPSKYGLLKVIRTNLFRNTVSYVNEDNVEREMSLDEWVQLVPQSHEEHTQDFERYPDSLKGDDLYMDAPIADLDDLSYAEGEDFVPMTPFFDQENKAKSKKKKKKKKH